MPRSRSMSIRSRYCARIGPAVDDAGELQHPVGQRRLAVVDVGDDAEVADHRRVGGSGLRGGAGGHGGQVVLRFGAVRRVLRRRPSGTCPGGGWHHRPTTRASGPTARPVDRIWPRNLPTGTLTCRAARCPHACPTPRPGPIRYDERKGTGTPWRTSSRRSSATARTRLPDCATSRSSRRSRPRCASSARPLTRATPPRPPSWRKTATRALDKAASQGRHPPEPGRQPQVGDRLACRGAAEDRLTHPSITKGATREGGALRRPRDRCPPQAPASAQHPSRGSQERLRCRTACSRARSSR